MQNDFNLIVEDEWTLSAPVFGASGQIRVLGWVDRHSKGNKIYLVECSVCKNDSELYGSGRFKTYKSSLIRGRIPCGCSTNPKWSEYQYSVLCTRILKSHNYRYVGWAGNFTNSKNTRVAMMCDKHGQTCNLTINSIINERISCPGCHIDFMSKLKTKSDDEMVTSFHKSGAFHPDTKFWRSERVNKAGTKPYWHMSCPDCGETGEILSGDLQKGHRPCACSPMRQQECYINWIVNESGTIMAIKFGIANKTENRVNAQDKLSRFKVVNFIVYSLPTVESCKKAERECKKELECGILSKDEMPDGYTETTSVHNLLKIIKIYQVNGGVLKLDQTSEEV